MGAVTFSLDIKLLEELKNNCDLNFFVETGTFRGETVETVKPYFKKIFSIEMSEILFENAKKRFQTDEHVSVFQGDSGKVLGELSRQIAQESTLYWLDAHWCVADSTSGETSQCPLLNEIKQINNLNLNSVILIDDARLFLAPPPAPHDVAQWPTFHQIVEGLQDLSKDHEIMVINDIIAFYPSSANDAVVRYARDHGIDWLNAVNCLKQDGSFLKQLEDKEFVIQGLEAAKCEQQTALTQKEYLNGVLSSQIEEKEVVIQELLHSNKEHKRMNENLIEQVEGKETVIQELVHSNTEQKKINNIFLRQLEEKEAVIQELCLRDENPRSIVGRIIKRISE